MEYEDPEQNLYINFKKGQKHLNGADAEKFVRFREGFVQADIGRGNAQKLFLAAFIEKAKNSISITNVSMLSSLVSEILANLTTDISAADAVYFAKNALGVDMSNITMLTVPGDSVGGYFVINRGATLAAINAHFNVYDNDIIPAIFDKSRKFTSATSTAIAEAYYAENAALINEFNAQNIRKNSITIPMKPET
jgi:anionic cell wall polymer biosynthesis LytR-Cps2A-Psr (LCP) family protein